MGHLAFKHSAKLQQTSAHVYNGYFMLIFLLFPPLPLTVLSYKLNSYEFVIVVNPILKPAHTSYPYSIRLIFSTFFFFLIMYLHGTCLLLFIQINYYQLGFWQEKHRDWFRNALEEENGFKAIILLRYHTCSLMSLLRNKTKDRKEVQRKFASTQNWTYSTGRCDLQGNQDPVLVWMCH